MKEEYSSIVPMNTVHIPAVVNVHLASFPDFFLSFLGSRFLSLYYCGICSAPEGIAFTYLNSSGRPSGFVAGTSNPQGFYKRLLKQNWLRFSLASLGPIMRRPEAAVRIARALTHPGENPAGSDVAGLFSLGVHPSQQGIGLGERLVKSFLQEANARNCKRVFLTTDRDGNEGVNRFYKKLGFEVKREYSTAEGRQMNEYWIHLQ